jgi:hypothetical protein
MIHTFGGRVTHTAYFSGIFFRESFSGICRDEIWHFEKSQAELVGLTIRTGLRTLDGLGKFANLGDRLLFLIAFKRGNGPTGILLLSTQFFGLLQRSAR